MFHCRKSKDDYTFYNTNFGMYGNFTYTRYAISLKVGYDLQWSYLDKINTFYYTCNSSKVLIHYPVKTSDGIRNVLYTNMSGIWNNDRLSIGFKNVSNINQISLSDLAKQLWSNIFHSNDPLFACRPVNQDIILNPTTINEMLVIKDKTHVLTNF